jgi:electron transfer flavoprotein alpha subunit
MSVLVYVENTSGNFKKSALETVSYSYAIAQQQNAKLTAIVFGNADTTILGNYGVSEVLHVNDNAYTTFNAAAYANAIAQAAKKTNAAVVVVSNSFSGKGLAPRIAVKLECGFVDGAISLPNTENGFTVRKGAYSGKAFADVSILSAVKIIALNPNSFPIAEHANTATLTSFMPESNANDFKITVKETIKASDKISLPEAELVVSGGRGLKGPENWGMVEELASLLGAATACSKPVSDAHWRPHSEHVGQTGIAVSPNLYIAIGISGAIQHLAGVSSSKTIVVINKDPEAPFFKAADYGIVGDAFEVVPKLIAAVKAFKASNG